MESHIKDGFICPHEHIIDKINKKLEDPNLNKDLKNMLMEVIR